MPQTVNLNLITTGDSQKFEEDTVGTATRRQTELRKAWMIRNLGAKQFQISSCRLCRQQLLMVYQFFSFVIHTLVD